MARPRRQTLTMKQYLDNVKEGYISNDADTQRNPAWKPIVDGLSVTILTNDYIPSIILAEEDSGQTHIADGGSRTTAWMMVRFGNYKIKSSVENPIIPYKKMIKDKNEKITWEDATFDVRNKTFDQFPKELQKMFDEYQVDMVVHEHCDKEKIAMYIKRYNEHKAMNANQKMFVYLPTFAEKIRDITNKDFFINHSNINDNDKDKGILERIVSESVMCMFHLDKWNKNGKKLATYLNENGSESEFDELNDNIARLENIVTEETKVLFNSRDSFIWFSVFDKFTKFGFDDTEFGKFLSAFVAGLRNKSVDGQLFDRVDDNGSTKDKANIVAKLHILETLMKEYLHIEDVKHVTPLDFVKENVDPDITADDIADYEQFYEDDIKIEVDNSSKLLDDKNVNSMIALIAYVMNSNIKINVFKEWLVNFFNENSTYNTDQKSNYVFMRESLRKVAIG